MQAFNLPKKNCELHDVLRRAMWLCRWAGFFPVDGLDKKTITDLRFNIKSPYVLYYSTTLLFQTLLASVSAHYFFINNLNLNNLKLAYVYSSKLTPISDIITLVLIMLASVFPYHYNMVVFNNISFLFYLTGLLSAIFLLKLAKDWSKLINRAADIEDHVASIRTSTSRNYYIASRIVMTFALLEHLLSIFFKFKLLMINEKMNINRDLIRIYFIVTSPHVFQITTYAEWKAVIYEIANLQATFLWNLIDAVTICVSLYLSSYFKDLNKVIEYQEKQKSCNWKELRLYYSYLVELVYAVDENMCYLILLSFFTNVFFICVQLFSLVVDITHMEFSIYYAYSFLFLVIRASIASLLAANVNTVARQPLSALQRIPTAEYTLDVQRFIRQIRYTTTALSGLYFYITKGMLLSVISTVVTYELVMHQFGFTRYEDMKSNF